MANLKNTLWNAFANGNIFQHVLRQLGQIRVSYCLVIGNFLYQKNIYVPKNKFGRKKIWGLKFFPDFEPQIGQQHPYPH